MIKIWGIFIAIAVRMGGTGLQFLLTFFITKYYGLGGIGMFSQFISWKRLLATAYGCGLPPYTLREVSVNVSRGQWGTIRESFKKWLLVTILVGGALAFGTVCFKEALFTVLENDDLKNFITYSAIGAVLLACVRICAETLKGMDFGEYGIAVEFIVAPGLTLIVVLLGIYEGLEDVIMIHCWVLGFVLVICGGRLMFVLRKRISGTRSYEKVQPLLNAKSQLIHFYGVAILNTLLATAPYFVIPIFGNKAQVGTFSVCHRLIAFSATILYALGCYFGPKFAQSVASSDYGNAKRLYLKSCLCSIFFYSPFLAIVLSFPDFILGLFDIDVATSGTLLFVMAIARVFNAGFGLGEQFLNMSGNQKTEFYIGLAAFLSFMFIGIYAGSAYGLRGVVFVYSVVFAVKSGVSAFCVLYILRSSKN